MTTMKLFAIASAMTIAAAALPASAATIEDFESGSFGSNWTNPTTERTSAAAAHDGARGLVSGSYWHYNTTDTVKTGDTLSAWFDFTSRTSRSYLGFGATDAGASSFVLAPNTASIEFQNNDNYDYASLNSATFAFATNHWYLATVTFGSSVVGNLYDSDGTTLLASLTADGLDHGTGGVAIRSFGANYDTIAINESTPAVPEPATWAMMILGVGAIGFAMRSAKRRSDEKFDAKIKRITQGALA